MVNKVLRSALLLLSLSVCGSTLVAQRGFGFRFASNFNHFFRAEQNALIDGSFSTLVIGPYYQAYFSNGGWQAGLNFVQKGNTDKGFPNLPVVMRDYNGPHNVGFTALEFDMKVGPRFGPINPKIGYIIGYRFKHEGMVEPAFDYELRDMYVNLPFGVTADFPVQYGSVGFGIHYLVGLTGQMKPPAGINPNFTAGTQRALNIELFVVFASGKQERPVPPPPGQ